MVQKIKGFSFLNQRTPLIIKNQRSKICEIIQITVTLRVIMAHKLPWRNC
ncbi:MAG: hypothetical protein JWR09_5588 [Mucilaginibacter sp.]|nr:hypothetical protein [Mucilaginibacter sp.]